MESLTGNSCLKYTIATVTAAIFFRPKTDKFVKMSRFLLKLFETLWQIFSTNSRKKKRATPQFPVPKNVSVHQT